MRHRIRRLLRASQRRAQVQQAPVILMYHRVAQTDLDPWGLVVTPAHFASQLAWLKRHRHVLTMESLVSLLRQGRIPPRAVALTFDDGYVDNLVHAQPLLVRYASPATLFMTTGGLQDAETHARCMWWDLLARWVLRHRYPLRSEVRVAGHTVSLSWGDPLAADRPGIDWRAWDRARTPRQRAYQILWQLLRGLGAAERDSCCLAIHRALGYPAWGDEDRLMREAEIHAWLRGPGCSLGGHTVHHLALSTLSTSAVKYEIETDRERVTTLVGAAINGFAYPFGDHSPQVQAAARQAGYAWACSTEAKVVPRHAVNYFALPRLAVPNIAGHGLLGLWAEL